MPVKIVTDSVADLPSQVVSELGITIVPLNVRFGTEVYRDGVDLTAEQFYDRLVHSQTPPVTSVPSPGIFAEAYDKLAEETDEILAIIVSAKLSGTYEVALQSIGLMKRKYRVEVIDSQWAVMAEGFIVIKAAKAAQAGANLDEIVDLVHRAMTRSHLIAYFDTLKYLAKGGRIGKAQGLLGAMLSIKPILTVKDGEMSPLTRLRSRTAGMDYLYNFVAGLSRIEGLAVEHATTPEDADKLVERLSSVFPKERIYRSTISPVVGTYAGPGAMAVSVLEAEGNS